MPFKPFAHLARVSIAKGITHAYAPSAVVAGQSLGFHNSSVAKFSKASHLQNAFAGPSSSGSGAGAGAGAGASAKASHVGQNIGGDAGLAQYYAAWQHAQQTGDDTDWKQHQFARSIGWKGAEKPSTVSKPSHHRLDSIKAADLLRPSTHRTRGYSDTAVAELKHADDALTEVEALAKVDEAIAQEIKNVQEANASSVATEVIEQGSTETNIEASQTLSEHSGSSDAQNRPSPSTVPTSPLVGEALSLSDEIVQLGQQQRYIEIPQRFEAMIRDGLVPTVDAYNQILVSAIELTNGYQPFHKALQIYGDMSNRSVAANKETYGILISYLTGQSLEAIQMQKKLKQQTRRYGLKDGALLLPSVRQHLDLYTGDTSFLAATKLYNIASQSVTGFSMTSMDSNALVETHARHNSVQSMKQVMQDMRAAGFSIELDLYTVIIDACGSVKDVESAKKYYAEYRDRAIGRRLETGDIKVYVALIRAFYAAGQEEKGIRFYEQILESFEGTADKEKSSKQVTDAFVVDGLIQYHIESGNYELALEGMELYPLTDRARSKAFNKICTAAADSDKTTVAAKVFGDLHPAGITADCAMAVSAMHFRAGQVDDALAAWATIQQFANPAAPSLDYTTMHTTSLMMFGKAEQGLAQARNMFRQIRSAETAQASNQVTTRAVDEAISFFEHSLSATPSAYSPQAIVHLFRLMIENGGLVPSITQDAVARLGPDCVHQLGPQDIALALHVQAHMLPAQASMYDTAHAQRFAHLLETVLDRGILMDPSTIHAVGDAIPRLGGVRPDLERRWSELMRPTPPEVASPRSATSLQSQMSRGPTGAAYDPYAHLTDHRASRSISDLLESTSGRPETNLADAMSRLRNVRRMGRHLQYGAYAKLITAAGKVKQSNLMHEIISMAQTDVPLNHQIPTVVAGWVSIYDAMVAACLTVNERQVAAKYHNEIRALGSAPSANTFGIYITTLEGTFDEATEAVKIFQQAISEGVTPSVFLFNAVIGKLGKARRIDDCLHYFAQMQERGIKPSSVTYGTLVNALCRTSEESFAVQMFDEMESASNYRPRPAPYNSIIQYFLNTKRDRSKVLQYYGRMRTHNIKPTSHTYKLLIEAWATLDPINLTAAETVLADMKANGVQPEAVHYGSLIHARGCVLGDMAGARKVFDSVLADKSIRATDNLYQNLLESMVANHQVDQTDDILLDMSKRGIAMTPYIANTLIHGWAGKGDIAKARSIYDSLGSSNREPSTYEAMTRACIAAEDHAGAQVVVGEMLRKGYPSAVSEKVMALIGGNI